MMRLLQFNNRVALSSCNRQATNGLDNDLSDTRLIVEYPLSIL
ncbi:hypothetical protein [Stutzerimonas xanthomarina]|nr:hypothetical protein [Stutzerimonas xanthomarina]